MTGTQLPDLWTCPKCGARFVTRNMSHSCVTGLKPEDLFAKSEPWVLEVFLKFEKLVRACGQVTRIVQKSRVTFMVRVRFASLYPRKEYFDCGLFLKRRINNPRFWKIEHLGASNYIHHIKLHSADQFDAEFKTWLQEAYQVGEQRHLLTKEA
ncbi:MAG: DUF5655 domain-containing protein [Chloroflexi bacterium]|nr:DUF5655 domain-containing protein [Chloroflexota bacterium]